MIYLIALGVAVAIIAFYNRVKTQPLSSLTLDVLAAASLGWVAGLLIGVGARIGMWAIPMFNGTEPSVSFEGTSRVILTFSIFGIGLGVFYELIFRKLFHRHGSLLGLLVTLITTYPFTQDAIENLRFTPSPILLYLFTFLFVALTFVPFSIALECLLARWHRCRDTATSTGIGATATPG